MVARLLGPGLTRSRARRNLQILLEGSAAMMDVTRGVHGEVVIRIGGAFDRTAASRLEGWLGELSVTEPVVVDFSAVRDCEDYGLASVAPGLASHGQLVVRGLTRHQERMLRYFGVNLDAPAQDQVDDEARG